MKEPSGDQLNRRKKVFAGEDWKGLVTVAINDQSSVDQIFTDLSSDWGRVIQESGSAMVERFGRTGASTTNLRS